MFIKQRYQRQQRNTPRGILVSVVLSANVQMNEALMSKIVCNQADCSIINADRITAVLVLAV